MDLFYYNLNSALISCFCRCVIFHVGLFLRFTASTKSTLWMLLFHHASLSHYDSSLLENQCFCSNELIIFWWAENTWENDRYMYIIVCILVAFKLLIINSIRNITEKCLLWYFILCCITFHTIVWQSLIM